MILEVRDVVRRFGGVRAVDGASLDVEEGSITALIGPNGAGKSTLFNVVSGFLRAEHGTVRFEGKRIDRSPAHRIARGGLVRTFQMPRTLARLSVLDNMLLAAQRPERARELLALVRLESHAADYAGVLSGGNDESGSGRQTAGQSAAARPAAARHAPVPKGSEIRQLLQAYAKVRALSADERAHLPLLARGAALRFLLTRVVDWLDVPAGALVKPKDPLEYFRKLRFHQTVQSVRDYGIAD